ncbi:MAG: fibronectin type III domain-containing protein [Nonomuraea sp.]|nr:fibronectin type III domain-containing protein [Nonomuraea sp.]
MNVPGARIRVNGGPWRSANGAILRPADYGNTMASIEVEGASRTTYVALNDARPQKPTPHRQDRAMWIWEKAAYNLVLNPGSRRLLETSVPEVKTLYLGISPYAGRDVIEDARPRLRELIAWAHARGMRVHATVAAGTSPPYLGVLPQYRDRAVTEMERVLNYNLSSREDERFDGINVDIEPYILPWFRAEQPEPQIQWLDTLRAMIERRDAAGSPLLFGPAIPRWLDTLQIPYGGATKPLSEHIQDMSDYIAIMDYRDQAQGGAGIIAQAQNEIAYGKPLSVVLGVETLDIATSGDPATITFREEGRDAMEAELSQVYQAFAGSKAFAGVAMHHYESIRALPTVWGPTGVFPAIPPDSTPPTAVDRAPSAVPYGHATVDLAYGRAYDDVEVARYEIYRGDALAGSSTGLTFTDTGLLPETSYTYRVVPVDVAGRRGPASAPVTVTTGSSALRPVIVDAMELAQESGAVRVRVRMVDQRTGEPVAGTVRGRFTYSAGRYVTMTAGADGWATATSETPRNPVGQVGFAVHRVSIPGAYWAPAYDRVKDEFIPLTGHS